MAPTFADELRRQAKRQPNIVSIALKPRSSIGLGGHGGREAQGEQGHAAAQRGRADVIGVPRERLVWEGAPL